MSGRVIAGIGCRAGCAPEEIVALVQDASARAGRAVGALATPRFKQGEAGLHEAARRLAVPLLLVGPEDLAAAQPNCPTRSLAAQRATGVASVAEGSALAASGPGARLLLARIARGAATCALAEAAS
ncbi:MAG: cobalamin biosynthesis protein [Acetobacteraceae bacterium]